MQKVGLAESMFMVAICGLADLFEFVITVILLDFAGAGEFMKYFIDIVVWPIMAIWLKMKGVRQTWFTVGSLIELIPVADAFPTRTIAIIATIKIANSEKLSAIAEKVTIPSKTSLRHTATQNITTKVGAAVSATASTTVSKLENIKL